jgi:ATP-binding cassette, subfamily F, member 3
MICINNLTLAFGAQKIYDHMSCTIADDDRIGLVGRNGSGKSTLLKLIAEACVSPNSSISIAKNKTVAYFPQEVVLQSDKSIFDETLASFKQLSDLLQKAHTLEKLLEQDSSNTSVLEEYARIQEELIPLNQHKVKAEVQELLTGLGFKPEQFDQPVSQLSVGWKMRVVLAKLLLQNADFYLFDEPTNHLDIVAKDWFLNFLMKASFGFILVCHERYFLNKLCKKILELELGKAKLYTGNYTLYEHQKEHDRLLLEAAYLQQQKEIQTKQATIDRFRYKASKAKMAQSMIKSLEKVERITLPPSPKNVAISFPPVQQSGKTVMQVEHVSYSFDKKQLFKNVTFTLERGDKVALIAPNGAGKTTLFNLISGNYPLQNGKITFGHNVKFAVFDQDQTAALPLEKTIIEAIEESSPRISQQVIRTTLGAFLFSNEDVNKKIKVLSGGEKNRVGMIKILLQDANLLLLDEPTNHLDIPSKEVLLKALQQYHGTILFVSHDQDFINELATKILELTPSGALLYQGNYDTYRYH